MLVAATGVGAGDLATATFTGIRLGTAVLWAVVAGGILKFVLTEGLARWQLATGQTFLEGAAVRLSRAVGWLFLPYLLLFSFFVGSALMSANGVTLHALFPVFDDADTAKIAFGVLASAVGLAVVRAGGFPLFEKIMGVCVALMFVCVVATAGLLWPGTGEVLRGLFVPTLAAGDAESVSWTIALMGGVGGTVTILCYGYWIREKGREGAGRLAECRLDLGAGYLMTALFGIAMVIIGSTIRTEGQGADLLVVLGERLNETLGPAGRIVFLIGALGAVFSSLLGVWQSVPYLFADIHRLFLARVRDDGADSSARVDERAPAYRWFLYAIATLPVAGLVMSFRDVQKIYAVTGAFFLPLLALGLLVMNGRRAWVGGHTNRASTVVVLAATLIFFGWLAFRAW